MWRSTRRSDDDFRVEVEAHLALEADRLVEEGWDPEEARAAAARRFGNVTSARERFYESRRAMWLDDAVVDVRHAWRTLARSPGFATAALLTLALGIGPATAVFSVVYGVLLRPLPYPDSERLVRLWEEHPGATTAAGNRWLSNRTLHAWAPESATLDAVGAYGVADAAVDAGLDAIMMPRAAVSPAIFGMVGAAPALGRFFTGDDVVRGDTRVVVLSDQMWRQRYGADPDVLGKPLVINEEPHVIIGVASRDLVFPDRRVRFWIPDVVPRVEVEPERTVVFTALGRLKPGATPAQAEAEGTAVARAQPRPLSTELFFGQGGPVVVHARTLAQDLAAPIRPALVAIAVAVALVLLVACANVANLFLSRGVSRQRELAVRLAIGAGRWRIVRQLLTESAVLSAVGGVAGVALAWWLIRIAPVAAANRFPRMDEVRLDADVVAFAALASVLTGLLSGVAPALRGAGVELIEAIRGDTTTTRGRRDAVGRRLRDGILAVESGFAVVLLVGASLMAHSLVQLTRVDAGYDADRVVVATVRMPRTAPPEHATRFIDGMLGRLSRAPGVAAAGAANMTPMSFNTAITSFSLPSDTGGEPVMTRSVTSIVTPGYAETVGLRLRAGRFFTDEDRAPGTRAMIVNEEFAHRYLTAGPIVGRRIGDMYFAEQGITTEIVGLVGNVLKDGHDREPEPEIYFVHDSPTRRIQGFVNLVVRARGAPAEIVPVLRDLIHEADPTAIVQRVEPLEHLVAESMAHPRVAAGVLAGFAALALLLASVGLFAVSSYNVAERRREISLRAALGAGRGTLVRMVVREGLIVVGLGLVAGLLAAAGLTRLLEGILFGITPLDGLSFAIAPLVLIPVALAACLIPAFRAASADPALMLRHERQ